VIRLILHLFARPALYILLTLAVYALSLRLHRRWAWIHPLLSASVVLIFLLWELHIPYASYNTGGGVFTYLLGPATVALGVPMYKQGIKLKATLPRLSLVVFAGSAVGMITAGGVASLCGASHRMVMSALPKSVTTPIAIEVSRSLHGDPAITAAMVLLTGLVGAVIGPGILRLARILHDHAVGAAIGASSHAIGTASLFRSSETQGTISSLAMAMAGIFTSVLAMLLNLYWRAQGSGHP
jgi:predicted murein hydrolase (TIGR00659 family)